MAGFTGFGALRVSQTLSSHREHHCSTPWQVLGFFGFHRLHQVTGNITTALYGWVFSFWVLRVLQTTSSHRQYYWSTTRLDFGFLGF